MSLDSTEAANQANLQMQQISEAQWHILLIVTGVLISYGVITEQGHQIQCAAQGKSSAASNVFALKLFASLLILNSLVYFYQATAKAAKTPADTAQKCMSKQVNLLASGMVLLAGVLRLWDILCLQSRE